MNVSRLAGRGILTVCIHLLSFASFARSPFVIVVDHQFFLNNKPYHYIGSNYWYGGFLGLQKDKSRGVVRLRKELDFLKSKGVTNLRLLAGVEGSGMVNGVNRVQPALQQEEGKFTTANLDGLDLILYEMGKRNMKAVVFLSNNWEWSGGFLQYLRWNNQINDTVFRRKLSWNEQRDYTSKFYSCDNCIAAYKKQVQLVVGRMNKYTKKKYSQDPAIMAWELVNEPRPMRPAANEAYKQWISNTAAYIKSLDQNHLVTTGHEGAMGVDNDMPLYEQLNADKNVDYLTIHIWPKNWGWFSPATMEKDLPRVINNTTEYINKHVAIATQLRKPLVIEEFGLPRDKHSFDVAATTTLRDQYYSTVFAECKGDQAVNNIIGGVNFWAFGGSARPIPGQTFWKEGDDYMGDPPMEEQGLNTVFDSDASTWKVIESYAKNAADAAQTTSDLPVDKQATKETVNLYHNLKKLLNKGTMFGHQDDLAYGVGWKYVPGKSDVKEVTGDYPAVYGWELGRLELDHDVNIDSVPFDKMKGYIRDIYNRGGVTTISWHLNNPLTGKTAWDPAPGTVASILPGGEKNDLYKSWLNKVAAFMLSLKGKNGELIPVIFRPFHELNGNWFWWGKDHCTPDEYRQIYQFTVAYLRDAKKVHNLLYAFNTDRFSSKEEYLQKFPGDEWTDVIGFDIYQRKHGTEANEQFASDADHMLTMLGEMAKDKNKIPALTEFGYPQVADSTWWTSTLAKAIAPHKISYALAWRNAGQKPSGENEYYLPYKGQLSEKDFVRFYDLQHTLFQKDVTRENIYK